MTTISFIVPAYNIEEKLERCIESILRQSIKKKEIVIVNDSSTDNTGDLCEALKSKYNCIKVVTHTGNKGLPAARNSGYRQSKGDYIWHVDGDDYLADSEAAESIVRKMREDNTHVAKFGIIRKQADKSIRQNAYREDAILDGLEVLKRSGANAIVSYIYSRLFSEKLKLSFLEGISIGEDQIFVTKMLRCAASVSVLSSDYYVYDLTGESMMRSSWSFEKYLEDRAYFRHACRLLCDRPNIFIAIGTTRKNYLENNLLFRAQGDLTAVEYDMYREAVAYDINLVSGLNYCFSNVKLDDRHFSEFFANVEFVIHAGVHKTATTTIQTLMEYASEDMALHDVIYIDMNEFRSEITTRMHELDHQQIRTELLKLALRMSFRKPKRIVISEENLIELVKDIRLGWIKDGFRINRLHKLIKSLDGFCIKVYLVIRDYAQYTSSMHSEYCRHNNFMSFSQFFDIKRNSYDNGWKWLIKAIQRISPVLKIYTFESIRKDVGSFACVLTGVDIKYASQSHDYETRRSRASDRALSFMERSYIKSNDFFIKVDKYFTNSGKAELFDRDAAKDLNRQYAAEVEELIRCGLITTVDEDALDNLMIPNAKRFSVAADINGVDKCPKVTKNFYTSNFCDSFWKPLLTRNVEQIDEYNIVRRNGIKPGVSAMLRIKNEEMNIRTDLSSIKFLFEEIVIVDNGSTDHTMKVIEEFVKEEDLSDKVRIFSYPFEVAKCGDQNFETNEFSVHSLAYYYNWTLSKCTCKYIWKWDGDMVVDRSMVPDFIKFKNQVLENPGLVGVPVGITYYKVGLGIGFVKNDYYEMEPRLFPNSFLVCFKKDILWERLAFDYDFSMIKSEIPIYIELKDVTANEFGHWSNSSLAWGVRKVQEYKYFKEMQELVHSRKIAKNLSIPGYTRFDIKI